MAHLMLKAVHSESLERRHFSFGFKFDIRAIDAALGVITLAKLWWRDVKITEDLFSISLSLSLKVVIFDWFFRSKP